MEQHQKSSSKPKNKILKFLPKPTSSVSFQNPQLYSPVKDKKPSEKPHKSNLGIGFTAPMVSIVPSSESRRKTKNDVANEPSFTLIYEPTSPRVSCMGQVKCKHYRKLAAAAAAVNAASKPNNKFSKTTTFTPVTTYKKEEEHKEDEQKVIKGKKKLGLRGLLSFHGGSRKIKGSESDQTDSGCKTTSLDYSRVPSIGKMKRFSSGRDAFSNFDWTTQVTPLDNRNYYYTDDERDGGSDGEEVMIPSSAPVMERNKGVGDHMFVRVGGHVKLEPRKEINLWKRRTMAQPKPLQLHVTN